LCVFASRRRKLAVETTILSALEDGLMKRTRLESDRWFDILPKTETAQAAVMTLTPYLPPAY
jgi:hypothetical protein